MKKSLLALALAVLLGVTSCGSVEVVPNSEIYESSKATYSSPSEDSGSSVSSVSSEEPAQVFVISFYGEDGSLLSSQCLYYGETPQLPTTPTKEGDAQFSYVFDGWCDASGNKVLDFTVTGAVSYYAHFASEINSYTIIFKNDDGTILQSESYPYGETPIYSGVTPTKEGDAQYSSYTFSGWSPEIVPVAGDAAYKAVYDHGEVNSYTITFVDEDGTTILDQQTLPYGDTPVYKGEAVTKSGDNLYSFYSFTGWSPKVIAVKGDATYQAVYEGQRCKLTFSLSENGDYYSVSKSKYTANAVTIPSSYRGLPVTSIKYSAFQGCSSLTSITIPDSVTSIGHSAFEGCSSLESMTLPFVGGSASENCFLGYLFGASSRWYEGYVPSSLKEIVLSNSVTFIGWNAFYGCSSLTSITIPDSMTSIGKGAFSGCASLEYNECGNAFYLGNKEHPFLVLIKAKSSEITSCEINESTKLICGDGFSGCASLASIAIPDSVSSVGPRAFYNCTSLASITIPDSVTSIGEGAFKGCSSLTSIVIPDSVTSIGRNAFEGCSSMSVYYKGTVEQWNAISIDAINAQLSCWSPRYYFTSNGAEEKAPGDWWYYDSEGKIVTL